MRRAAIVLGAVLLLGGCGHQAQRPAPFDGLRVTTPAPAVDAEIRSLRAQLARARAERDAALARLHAALRRKSTVVRVVVREPAAAPPHPSDSGQPATHVFTTLTTGASP